MSGNQYFVKSKVLIFSSVKTLVQVTQPGLSLENHSDTTKHLTI